MNCQDGQNTMRTIQQLDLSRLWPLQWSGTVGKGHPFSNAVIQCAFPALKHLRSLELLKHAQLACHRAGFHDPGPRWNHQSSTYLSNTLALNFPELSPIACISATFSNIDVVYELTANTYVLGDTLAITALQTTITRGRLSLIRIEDHKEQICRFSRSVDSFEYSAWCNLCQQQDSVLRVSFASWQEVSDASVEPWVAALAGSQRRQNLLSSAPIPSYCMLGILPDTSPSQRSARHAHKITETATLIEQLRKRTYKKAWGTCKEPWGFAGSLGCLQCLSCN